MKNLPFFVYGTLRPGEGNYAYLLEGRTVAEDTATLPGAVLHDYNGGSFPFMVLSDDQADLATGTLITVSDEDFPKVLLSLDRLEGYSPERPDQGMYRREVMNVTIPGQIRTVPAYVYICGHRMLGEVRKYPRITSGDWLNREKSNLVNRFTD